MWSNPFSAPVNKASRFSVSVHKPEAKQQKGETTTTKPASPSDSENPEPFSLTIDYKVS